MHSEIDNANEPRPTVAHTPPFLTALGLTVPVSLDDVEHAFREKVKTAHPDHGGSEEAFKLLDEAYRQAIEYAHFRSGRRRWLAAQVDRFMEQEALLASLAERKARVDFERIDWMVESVGADFAQLLDQIVGLHMTGPKFDDEVIDLLADHRELLTSLHTLDLSSSAITDRGLARLMAFGALRHLNLRSTQITVEGLEVLGSLPALRTLDIQDVELGWLGAWKLRRTYSNVEIMH